MKIWIVIIYGSVTKCFDSEESAVNFRDDYVARSGCTTFDAKIDTSLLHLTPKA